MGWFRRKCYRQKILWLSTYHRLASWCVSLIREPYALESYRPRLEYLTCLLEDKLNEEVHIRLRVDARVAEIVTLHDVIAKVTVFPVGIGFRRDTYVLVRINPRYRPYVIWFNAAFAGLRQNYRELKYELKLGQRISREP